MRFCSWEFNQNLIRLILTLLNSLLNLVCYPYFFQKKSDCSLGEIKKLDYPERLRHIWVGWIFAWFGVVTPLFCLKSSFGFGGGGFSPSITIFYWLSRGCAPPSFLPEIEFWLRQSEIFHLKSQSFIGLRLPWKIESNASWLNFCLIWVAPPPFLLKNEFWLMGGGKFFHLQSLHLFGLRLPWNF